ncbi:MAG: fumarylacetoacetate hydrolase family protein [Bacteroidales bacterium]|nr:fumarylacetoacetate hydrolase family protein [Bacteroidales bacterium]
MKIICIGRNYRLHAEEFNNPVPENPIFFLKPDTALLRNNEPFFYPDFSNDIHCEVELVYRICKVGKNIHRRFAHRYFDAIALGIDFTARDLQQYCKRNGLPWEIAKSFDHSAAISQFIEKTSFNNLKNISFSLFINGKLVQHGNSNEMIFSIEDIIAYTSKFITFKTSDYIFTGTPHGVRSINIGDHIEGYIEDNKMLDFYIR